MKDCFITDDFVIDLSQFKINFTEENPRFKDTFWTKYTLPVTIHMTRDFKSKIGHYSSFTAMNLKRYHEGIHVFEGKMYKGRIDLSDIQDETAEIQINSGFETLPNFDKKLNELPFPRISVDDVYKHANDIVKKSYPEVNYNFPKLIPVDYNKDAQEWKYFEGFINNRILTSNGYIFPQNTVENDGMDVYNRNILHPLLYLLYVLKVGFFDAGFTLMGDVLEDPLLKHRLIYSPEKYYTTGEQEYQKETVFQAEFYDNELIGGEVMGKWDKVFQISAPGKYRIIGYAFTEFNGNCTLTTLRNGTEISVLGSGTTSDKLSFDILIEVSVDQAAEGVTIELNYNGKAINDSFNAEGVNTGVALINLNPIRQNTPEGEAIPFIFNSDIVDLKKACPDLTFGEIVTTLKNWLNYELIFDGNLVFMNKIKIDKEKEPEDFRMYETKPKWKFTDKQSFYLKFPNVEGLKLENIFYDESGYQLSKPKGIENTTEIPINGFCLPEKKIKGITTVKAYNQNELMLVYYNGLDSNGENHAENPSGLHGKELAEHNKGWYMNRLTNRVFTWIFRIAKSKLQNYNIRSEIFAYNKKHWIKSWRKNSDDFQNNEYYSVEIETETF